MIGQIKILLSEKDLTRVRVPLRMTRSRAQVTILYLLLRRTPENVLKCSLLMFSCLTSDFKREKMVISNCFLNVMNGIYSTS